VTSRRFRGGIVAGVVSAVLLAPGAPVLAQHRPPGLLPAPDSVEGGLWGSAEKAERSARNTAELNVDPVLNAYVREVACKTAPEYCDEIRIYVMDRPIFNATAAPNGYIEVWSGLLLRARSEAGLAFVLGHEVGHYAENHSLERWKSTKGWMTAAMIVTLGAGLAGAYYQVDMTGVGDLIYLGALSSVYGYGRGQESEADSIGLRRLAAAGYDPRVGAELWRALQEETKVSSFANVRRSEASPSIFNTHPLTAERVVALQAQAEALAQSGAAGEGRRERARYRAVIRPHLSAWLADERNRRDFGGLLAVIDRLAEDGEDLGVLQFHRGEVYRQRREDGDAERARTAYRAASTQPDAPVAVWRELGDLEARLGDPAAAAEAWRRYLAATPEADDRWIVEDNLSRLGGVQ
jgi:predicted Zn-dependent protease